MRRAALAGLCIGLLGGCIDFPDPTGVVLDAELDEPEVIEPEVIEPEVVEPDAADAEADVAAPDQLEVVVTPGGGSGEYAGVVLVAPAGAVDETVTVVGTPAPQLAGEAVFGLPQGWNGAAESPWTFAPDGLEFVVPIAITLPLAGDAYPSVPIPILVWEGDRWGLLRDGDQKLVTGVQTEEGGVRFPTSRLETFAIARVPDQLLECVQDYGVICPVDLCNVPGEELDCDDKDLCNGVEGCDPALGCVPADPLLCDDGDLCNGVETCDPTGGCVQGEPPACDDGDACNGEETCTALGGCEPGQPLACDDENPCNGFEICEGGACTDPPDLECDDGKPCNGEESCVDGLGCQAGVPLEDCCTAASQCDDANPCNGSGWCELATGTCQLIAPVVCGDGNPCNGVEYCDQTLGCQTGPALPCDDGNACNGFESCHPELGCVKSEPLVCNDKNACNGLETCQPLVGCVPGEIPVCDDKNLCNGFESCHPVTGCVTGLPFDCDDSKPCTGVELCHPVVGCLPGIPPEGCCHSPAECEDDDLCNGQATCNLDTQACELGAPLECDDDNACNGKETCHPTQSCQAGDPLFCKDDNLCNGTEACDPKLACTSGEPLDCLDENLCDGQETCDPLTGCVPGTPLVCDDKNACNGLEECEQATGCKASEPLPCSDGNVCTGFEGCDPQAGCTEGTALECADDDACNGAETCHPLVGCQGGEPPVCDDGNLCTVDSCDPTSGCETAFSVACSLVLVTDPGNEVTETSPLTGLTLTVPGDATDTVTQVWLSPNPSVVGSAGTGQVVSGYSVSSDGPVSTMTIGLPILEAVWLGAQVVPGQAVEVHYGDGTGWESLGEIGVVSSDGSLVELEAGLMGAYALELACTPACAGACGDDGCGGPCGSCTTTEPCVAVACVGGVCVESPSVAAQCLPPCESEADCDDGDACTTAAICAAGVCLPGAPVDCNDGDVCTEDGCDPDAGCTNAALDCEPGFVLGVWAADDPSLGGAPLLLDGSPPAIGGSGGVLVLRTGAGAIARIEDGVATLIEGDALSGVRPEVSVDEDGGQVAFAADGGAYRVVGSTVESVVPVGFSLGGGAMVSSVRSPVIRGESVAVWALTDAGQSRILLWTPTGVTEIGESAGWLAPNLGHSPGFVASLGWPPLGARAWGPSGGDEVAFWPAQGSLLTTDSATINATGTIAWTLGGALRIDGDVLLQAPAVRAPAINAGGDVAFLEASALRVWTGGKLRTAAALGDPFGGSTIGALGFRLGYGDGGLVAFAMTLDDGRQAIAVATPGCKGPLVCGDETDPCAEASTCQQGVCVEGGPLECGDGDACNGEETCAQGACQPGSALSCDDQDPCTVDSCSAAEGCQYAAFECGAGAVCVPDQGSPTCPCGPGAVPDGFGCEDVAGALDGLRWEIECGADVPTQKCESTPTAPQEAVLGGTDGLEYDLMLRFRGVIERKSYADGSFVDGLWQVGGDVLSADVQNKMGFSVSAPQQSYWVNAAYDGGAIPVVADYQQTVRVAAGATVAFVLDDIDGLSWKNTALPGVEGVPPWPDITDGQFLQLDVVDVIAVCDDGLECTADGYVLGVGCVSGIAGDGTACDDGELCTKDDQCTSGLCAGTDYFSTCADLPCHITICVGGGLCDNLPAEGPCDDENACTFEDSCDEAGNCLPGIPEECTPYVGIGSDVASTTAGFTQKFGQDWDVSTSGGTVTATAAAFVVQAGDPGSASLRSKLDLGKKGGRYRFSAELTGTGASQWVGIRFGDNAVTLVKQPEPGSFQGHAFEVDPVGRRVRLVEPTTGPWIGLDAWDGTAVFEVRADATAGGVAGVELTSFATCTPPCADDTICTIDTCEGELECDSVATQSVCDDGDPCTLDGCDEVAGCEYTWECPSSCREVLFLDPDTLDGTYAVDPDGEGGEPGYLTHCDMTLGTGGWTLAAVAADDQANNWTWNNKAYWGGSDTTVFGDVTNLTKDLRSPAIIGQPMRDLLFVHSSGTWAAYHGVGDGAQSLGERIDATEPACNEEGDGVPLSEGTLVRKEDLCGTRLYFNARDPNGDPATCQGDDDAWGPVWSANAGKGCPLDDPGLFSLGPNKSVPTSDKGRGFAKALGLFVTGGWTRVYVRAPIGCDGEEPGAPCDDLDPCTTGDQCVDGACVGDGACPRSCAEHQADTGGGGGQVLIDPDQGGPLAPYDVLCLPSAPGAPGAPGADGGGGWTLVAVQADDGQENWTWANRHYWDDDETVFGDLTSISTDLKSRAYHDLAARDVLFVHRPSGVWAAYGAVGDGSQSLAEVVLGPGEPECLDPATDGFAMTAGTLGGGDLCSTDLFFNASDAQGEASCSGDLTSYGPVWSASPDGECPFDGAGNYALGTSAGATDAEAGEGFAAAIGAAVTGDWTEIFVRAPVGCEGKLPTAPCDDGDSCTLGDVCAADGTCAGEDLVCDDSNDCTVDSCVGGQCVHAPCPISCADARLIDPEAESGVRLIDPDGAPGDAPYPVYCNQDLDGGGWTLAVVKAEDAHRWTWNNSSYWESAQTLFGTPNDLTKDVKSRAMQELPMSDVLFVHAQTGMWAAYHDVGDGEETLQVTIADVGGSQCWTEPTDGYALSAGPLKREEKLCDTRLYFNARDQDGSGCDETGTANHSYGPVWNANWNGNGCPFDDPARVDLGPDSANGNNETAAMGFASALGIAGTDDQMRLFVRGPVGCLTKSDGDPCDDGDPCTAGDVCSGGVCAGSGSCPGSCQEARLGDPSAPTGPITIDPDGPGGNRPYRVHCDQGLNGGGWTLVAISADDGQHNWTWNERHSWDTIEVTFGNPDQRDQDLKNRGVHDLKMQDLLFVHPASGVWAAYHQVGDATQSLGEHIFDVGEFACPDPDSGGHAMSAGTLVDTEDDKLCSTRLFFNAADQDGPDVCTADGQDQKNPTYGPHWDTDFNDGCPFDDPQQSGFGVDGYIERWDEEWDSQGFARAAGLEVPSDTIELYVRAPIGCDSKASGDPCDDGIPCSEDDTCQGDVCAGSLKICDDLNPCTIDSCLGGECLHEPVGCPTSCADLFASNLGATSGLWFIDPDGAGGQPGFQVHCEMALDSGGWTLVAVVADDGNDSWTWTDKGHWETPPPVPMGDVTKLDADLASPALYQAAARDVLFVHPTSGVWASYHGVADGQQSLAATIAGAGGPSCYLDADSEGWPMTAGSLYPAGTLCSTRLYLGCQDLDGASECPPAGTGANTWGPCWSTTIDDPCPFDDAEYGGLSISSKTPDTSSPHLGFATALGIEDGGGAVQVFVRAPVGCVDRPDGAACDDGDPCTSGDECLAEVCQGAFACPATCAEAQVADPALESGPIWLDADGQGGAPPYRSRCETALDSGGWTLVAVSADDGQDHWTWDARTLWTSDTTTFGTADVDDRDFKSAAVHDLLVADMLFVAEPSGVWASYADVGDGTSTLAELIQAVGAGQTLCWSPDTGYPKTAGTLSAAVPGICDTDLYFNAGDWDGGGACPVAADADDAYGPTWNTDLGDGCDFDDPGLVGFGSTPQLPDEEESFGGFGMALDPAAAISGTGELIRAYVRAPPDCAAACEDDGDPCTDTICSLALGCLHLPKVCDNGYACDDPDTCVDGGCVASNDVCFAPKCVDAAQGDVPPAECTDCGLLDACVAYDFEGEEIPSFGEPDPPKYAGALGPVFTDGKMILAADGSYATWESRFEVKGDVQIEVEGKATWTGGPLDNLRAWFGLVHCGVPTQAANKLYLGGILDNPFQTYYHFEVQESLGSGSEADFHVRLRKVGTTVTIERLDATKQWVTAKATTTLPENTPPLRLVFEQVDGSGAGSGTFEIERVSICKCPGGICPDAGWVDCEDGDDCTQGSYDPAIGCLYAPEYCDYPCTDIQGAACTHPTGVAGEPPISCTSCALHAECTDTGCAQECHTWGFETGEIQNWSPPATNQPPSFAGGVMELAGFGTVSSAVESHFTLPGDFQVELLGEAEWSGESLNQTVVPWFGVKQNKPPPTAKEELHFFETTVPTMTLYGIQANEVFGEADGKVQPFHIRIRRTGDVITVQAFEGGSWQLVETHAVGYPNDPMWLEAQMVDGTDEGTGWLRFDRITICGCAGGSCAQGPEPTCSDDGLECTATGYDPEIGCTHTPVDSACDDGDPCTVEHCSATKGCYNATAPGPACTQDSDCDDGDPCQVGACLADGKCHWKDLDCAALMDDACTAWICQSGSCVDAGDAGTPECAACLLTSCSADTDCTGGAAGDVDACVQGCCEYSPAAQTCDGSGPCTWYVDWEADAGGDGKTWATAFLTVQEGVGAASDFDQVWVKQGTYAAGGSTVLTMVENVALFGGFEGDETAVVQRPRPIVYSVLDGESSASPVVVGASNTLLSGFSIENGLATSGSGAGMRVGSSTNVTVMDCRFANNVATTSAQGGALWDDAPFVAKGNTYERCVFVENFGKHGGAVRLTGSGDRAFAGCDFESNDTSGNGGALINDGTGEITFSDCTFDQNEANQAGAVWTGEGVLTFDRCSFTGNEAGGGGGIKSSTGASVTVTQSVFRGNRATNGDGGAIVSLAGDLEVAGSTFVSNTSTGDGGAMRAVSTTVSIATSTFSSNQAAGNGGAGAFFSDVTKTLTDSTFRCSTGGHGGALRLEHGDSELERVTLWNNLATANGGAVYLVSGGATFTDGLFSQNTASTGQGGAVHIQNCGIGQGYEIRDSTFEHNSAKGNGGGVRSNCATSIVNSAFRGNQTDLQGGGVYLASAAGTVIQSSFFDNHAGTASGLQAGGAFVSSIAAPSISNCVFWGNTAAVAEQLHTDGGSPNTTCTQGVLPGNGGGPANLVITVNPFVLGTHGELFLNQSSDCVDLGTNAYADSAGILWTELTTQENSDLDAGQVDCGVHYPP